jgi:hypothetical protein
VESTEETPFQSSELSQVKYSMQKFKKERKIFNLTDSSGSDNSGEGEMTEQSKEKCHTV